VGERPVSDEHKSGDKSMLTSDGFRKDSVERRFGHAVQPSHISASRTEDLAGLEVDDEQTGCKQNKVPSAHVCDGAESDYDVQEIKDSLAEIVGR
jgi:hypothetical protein